MPAFITKDFVYSWILELRKRVYDPLSFCERVYSGWAGENEAHIEYLISAQWKWEMNH